MADSIATIKKFITDAFMAHPSLRQQYGFVDGDEFARIFSTVSLESILADIASISGNDIQQLIDSHTAEVAALVYSQKAHTDRWYQQLALGFMVDKLLIAETDKYDTTGMSDADISDAMIVKYCAVLSSLDNSEITIKIAGETGGSKDTISAEHLVQFKEYLRQTKDAGVRLRVVNEKAEILDFEAEIFYDPILLADDVKNACLAAAQGYINNLPFNGQYSNMALVDAMQVVAGAKTVQHKWSQAKNYAGDPIQYIDAVYTPYSGYFNLGAVTLTMIPNVL